MTTRQLKFTVFGATALALIAVFGFAMVEPAGGALPTVVVYKDANCGCCSSWIDHLESEGFDVEAHDVTNLSEIKQQNGVAAELGSCHTAIVDGYVIEGHVPAEDMKRLLRERPQVAGLAVPGMPVGSPGMEGSYVENYQVIAFDGRGGRAVYASH